MVRSAAAWVFLLLSSACGGQVLTGDDMARLSRLGPLPPPPPSPTNAVADHPEARQLGQRLFFDTRMSADGQVSCATCHEAEHGFADPKPLSVGAFGRVGTLHASTLTNVAYNDFQFWDGRADAVWNQAIQAIESEAEGDFSRCEVAHFIARHHAARFTAVFGPLPQLATVPSRCRPGDGVWEAMSEAEQHAVNLVFTRVGKAIEAYVRQLVSRNSRLDRFLTGDTAALTAQEKRGAAVFVREDRGRCIVCHDGPNLTDNTFHNLGVPETGAQLLQGRHEGITLLRANPLNGAGRYSDSPEERARQLDRLTPLEAHVGAFKTPTLRDVTRRSPLGHMGHLRTLEEWVEFHDRGGGDPSRDRFAGTREATLRPIGLSPQEKADLVAFLSALEGEPLPEELISPPADLRSP